MKALANGRVSTKRLNAIKLSQGEHAGFESIRGLSFSSKNLNLE
jgi:hypothetical protein